MAITSTPKDADQGLNAPGITAAPMDLAANTRIAEALVRALGDLKAAEKRGYARGWVDCGKAMAYVAAQEYERGYDAAGEDRLIEWELLQKQIHHLSTDWTMSFEARRAAEIAAVEARPGDFRGIEQDPEYIERCRASVESLTRNAHQRAA